MKKTIITLCCICSALLMQSCYNSTVCVGDMKPGDPAVCVNTIHNAHLIDGLVLNHDIIVKDYVAGQESYKVKHYRSFTDMLLSGLTNGIYTPTTTKIYLPAQTVKKQ